MAVWYNVVCNDSSYICYVNVLSEKILQGAMKNMRRMIQATIILFVMVTLFIIAYAVLAEPIDTIIDSLTNADATTGAEISDTMNLLKFIFGAAILIGIGMAFILYMAYGHKEEYES